jgi:hypothetical protein
MCPCLSHRGSQTGEGGGPPPNLEAETCERETRSCGCGVVNQIVMVVAYSCFFFVLVSDAASSTKRLLWRDSEELVVYTSIQKGST